MLSAAMNAPPDVTRTLPLLAPFHARRRRHGRLSSGRGMKFCEGRSSCAASVNAIAKNAATSWPISASSAALGVLAEVAAMKLTAELKTFKKSLPALAAHAADTAAAESPIPWSREQGQTLRQQLAAETDRIISEYYGSEPIPQFRWIAVPILVELLHGAPLAPDQKRCDRSWSNLRLCSCSFVCLSV